MLHTLKWIAESNEKNLPIVFPTFPPFHEDIYVYIQTYLCTITHMMMNTEHNETTPTIPFHLSREDSDVTSCIYPENVRKYAS